MSRWILGICLIFLGYSIWAQEGAKSVIKIEMKDGNVFYGQIIEESDIRIILLTEQFGEIKIQKNQIKSRTEISADRVKEGKVWDRHFQSARYFYAPNAYNLRKGESYYQNIYVLFNQYSVGITDRFSMGVGIVPLFLFAGTETPVWLLPKYSMPIIEDKLQISVGALAGTVLGLGGNFGITYGTLTLGNSDKNVSVGMGFGFADADWARRPIYNVAYMSRINPKTYFVTESYIINDGFETVILSTLGLRSILRSVGFDYGLVVPFSRDSDLILIPWLGLTVPFYKNKDKNP